MKLVTTSAASLSEQRTILRQVRRHLLLRYRPVLQKGAGPIRVMARMVNELEQTCREMHLSEEVIHSEVVNRTIGDVDVRQITECEGEPGGFGDYRYLAEELGIALPGEQMHGYTATGETYLWLRDQMMACEKALLHKGFDPRLYDLLAIGNPLLRTWLAGEMAQWGLEVTKEQVHLGIGAMDCIDKVLRGIAHMSREAGITDMAVLFPAPGFGVPEWQARSHGYRLHTYQTRAANLFKLTGAELDAILHEASDIRVFSLTVTNNPTTFAYSPDELQDLFAALRPSWQAGREIFLLVDLAYIGTGIPAEDHARMATFAASDVLAHTFFVSSFSKTYTLTGDRFGWVTVGDPELAAGIAPSWSNSMATLPAEWQLRFMVSYRLIQERPWLMEKVRAFYRLRRTRLVAQLQEIDDEQHLFAQIHLGDDATVYNWSQLRTGEDAFSLFEKTGIAGVPGSGFGYTDDYVRFSIGVHPIPRAPNEFAHGNGAQRSYGTRS